MARSTCGHGAKALAEGACLLCFVCAAWCAPGRQDGLLHMQPCRGYCHISRFSVCSCVRRLCNCVPPLGWVRTCIGIGGPHTAKGSFQQHRPTSLVHRATARWAYALPVTSDGWLTQAA